jgi:hypothetical protein
MLVFTTSWQIDASGRRLDGSPSGGNISRSQLTLEALCLNNVMGDAVSTTLIRRKPLELVGGFDPAIQYGEDWDLWLRLRCQGNFISMDVPLACRRQHGGSQWHSPRPETVDRRLTDHKRMLEKIFENWPGNIPAGLPERAAARAYGMAGYLDYIIGRVSLGKQRLELAIQLDPDYQSDLQKLPEQLKHQFLFSSSDLSAKTTTHMAVRAFEHWPHELELSDRWIARTLRDIFVHFLYTSYKVQDFSTTRYCLAKAIRYDPSLLRNRGIWSIGLEAFLGTRMASQLRRLAGHNRTK